MCDRKTAKRRLANRYAEQCAACPEMDGMIPLTLYISRNLDRVMRFDLLTSYDR